MVAAVPALVAAGAVLSAATAVVGGVAASKAASYNAQVAKNQAAVDQQNARLAAQAGQSQANAQSLKNAAIMGRIRAAQAASGLDINTGTATDVQETQRKLGQIDTEQTEQNALLQAYGFRGAASGATAEAGLQQQASTGALVGAGLGATGSLVSGASQIGFKWGDTSIASGNPLYTGGYSGGLGAGTTPTGADY